MQFWGYLPGFAKALRVLGNCWTHIWETLFSGLFWVGYTLYCSPVGIIVHRVMLAKDKAKREGNAAPHSICDGDNGFRDLGLGIFVQIVPMLDDNYGFLLIDSTSSEVAAVDPCDAVAVLRAMRQVEESMADILRSPLRLTTVLTTHYHFDHDGGNFDLIQKFGDNLRIFGGSERMQGVSGVNNVVGHNDMISFGNQSRGIRVLETPGHTKGHVSYFVPVSSDHGGTPCVFTGDALFHAGVGRFFECNAETVFHSLALFAKLPDKCEVFCGHEYSVENLLFSKWIDPDNKKIDDRLDWCQTRRKNRLPTIPSTICMEKSVNPFLRLAWHDDPNSKNWNVSDEVVENNEESVHGICERIDKIVTGSYPNRLQLNRDQLVESLRKMRSLKDAKLHRKKLSKGLI